MKRWPVAAHVHPRDAGTLRGLIHFFKSTLIPFPPATTLIDSPKDFKVDTSETPNKEILSNWLHNQLKGADRLFPNA